MGSGPAVELKIDDPATERARLEAIERAAAGAPVQTIVMPSEEGAKGDARPGESKSGGGYASS